MPEITIKVVTYIEELNSIQSIRKKVFQEEQGVISKLEFDGLDATAIHLLAYLDDKPVGTSRIRRLDRQTAKIERLAVLPAARGQGIGKKLMETALEVITNQNYQTVSIHAQEYIKELYEQLGFIQIGNRFEEAGIPHVKMIKHLKTLEIF
jgi:predicted GNAT family N-acyltransferase